MSENSSARTTTNSEELTFPAPTEVVREGSGVLVNNNVDNSG